MYKEHLAFESPEDENIKVWRYTDFTKLLSLLDKSALYFCRLDQLKDPFEGSLTRSNVEARKSFIEDMWKDKIENKEIAELMEREPEFNKNIRKSCFVNCWHINEHESAAMWKLYLKSNEGIAVQSTFAKLRECFNTEPDHGIFIGKINYIDYDSYSMKRDNLLRVFQHKRKSFEYEQELRALVWDIESFKKSVGFSNEDIQKGIYVNIDLSVLIDKIILAPQTSGWFHELVQSVTKRYKLEDVVETSSIDKQPFY